MSTYLPQSLKAETLRTLPGDDVRQIMWRFSDRYDLQMLVQSTRSVARGIVARLVAEGARNTHEWTARKNELLKAYDESGITAAFMEPEEGGFIAGPKNLALALTAFELAWVDGGAATGALAGCLALSPDPRARHARAKAALHVALRSGAAGRRSQALARRFLPDRADSLCWRRHRHAERQGSRRRVERRAKNRCCRSISADASSPTWASPTSSPRPCRSADERIKGSCIVILEEGDPGTFDRGTPTRKMVHQLVFHLRPDLQPAAFRPAASLAATR